MRLDSFLAVGITRIRVEVFSKSIAVAEKSVEAILFKTIYYFGPSPLCRFANCLTLLFRCIVRANGLVQRRSFSEKVV